MLGSTIRYVPDDAVHYAIFRLNPRPDGTVGEFILPVDGTQPEPEPTPIYDALAKERPL